jgi:hypothetical protein
LNDRLIAGAEAANCYDINSFLMILHQAQGISASGHRIIIQPENSQIVDYVTNRFCPIGSDATDLSLHVRVAFSQHFQCVVGGQVNDAALGYLHDLSGANYQNPAYGWADLPSWQVIVGQNAFGLTYRRLLMDEETGEDALYSHPQLMISCVLVGPSGPAPETRQKVSLNLDGVS